MVKRLYIVLGDKTTHGGTVITAQEMMTIDGKSVATVGCKVTCPRCRGTFSIIEGDPNDTLNGQPIAREGDRTECGAQLLAGGQLRSTHEDDNDGSAAATYRATVAKSAKQQPKKSNMDRAAAARPEGILVADATPGITPEQARMLLNVELDYRLALQSGGNRILTPLEIPDFSELSSGSTKNTEKIDFAVTRRKDKADTLTLEVLDGGTLIHTEPNPSALLDGGVWQWDGYDASSVLDTRVLKSQNLKVRLTASGGSKQQVAELPLRNKAKEVDWVDVKIDRSAKTAEVTVRPAFSDGGIKKPLFGKSAPAITPKTYVDLLVMAKQGIEKYWSRDGSRANGTNPPIQTAKGNFKVVVKADLGGMPKAKAFRLIEKLDEKAGRATSWWFLAKIYHNAGAFYLNRWPASYTDEDFRNITAHEFGHVILNGYGDGGIVPEYSWEHKGSSTLFQTPVDNHPVPSTGEIDLMHYHSTARTIPDYWDRSIAAEQDVKGLFWLARIRFGG